MNTLKLVTLAATEGLRVVVMGIAFIGLTVLAMLAGQYLLGITRNENAD